MSSPATTDPDKALADLVSPGTTVMLTTADQRGRLDSRPITVAKVDGTVSSYLIDSTAAWVPALRSTPSVHLTVSDDRHNAYVSVNGLASLSDDQSTIDALWNPAAAAFFDGGREDPNITVLRVDATEGQYWTAPSGRIGSLVSMLKAKFGEAEAAGEHGEVATGGGAVAS
jgi:general stress protein 26